MDDYLGLVVPITAAQLEHVANRVLTGIHDMFPPDSIDANNPVALKNLLKMKAVRALHKNIMGFMSNGVEKTI